MVDTKVILFGAVAALLLVLILKALDPGLKVKLVGEIIDSWGVKLLLML